MSYRKDFVHGDERLRVTLRHLDGDRYEISVGDRTHAVLARRQPGGLVAFEIEGGDKLLAATATFGDRLQVRVDGHTWTLTPDRGRAAATGAGAGSGVIEAPMTGTVLHVHVAVGQSVAPGDPVAVLTAMKMEHKLTADVEGRVVEVGATEGDNVDQGTVLVRIEPATDRPV